jgi:anti-sigma B factor antagonist
MVVDGFEATVDEVEPGSWRVTIGGDVDVATAPQLADVLRPLVGQSSPSVVVNLAAVEFMDSSGLRALVQAANEAKASGGSLVLTRVSTAVTRLLEVAGLLEHLHPIPSD